MSRISERGFVVLAGLHLLVSACAVGVAKTPEEFVEQNGAREHQKRGEDGGAADPSQDVLTSDAGETDSGVTPCASSEGSVQDSDADGVPDCADECPLDARSVARVAWYPDCDGDGNASATPRVACFSDLARETCKDGAAPDGGWSEQVGTDCDDEDKAASALRDYYPDCDNDGKASMVGTRACTLRDASVAFDCTDGQDPDGGFWLVPGVDCADEDVSRYAPSDWFPDCDGDGAATNVPVRACGIRAATATLVCADGKAPDGGFWSVAGTDCNDEDKTLLELRDWYADCDGDLVAGSVAAAHACGKAGAKAVYDCRDGQDPDGGFTLTKGTDCDDEDATLKTQTNWYADCDGDGESRATPTLACGTSGAAARSPCLDGQTPDGGFDSVAGVDCNDELSTNPCACGYGLYNGGSMCAPAPSPRSCLEVLTRDPRAADGSYQIDPDGNAATPLLTVHCDMSGGGYTEITRENFDAGDSLGWHAADGSGTPVDTTSSCRTYYSPMLGGVGILGSGAQTMKTYSLLGIPHTQVSVVLDYMVLDSWDGESALVYVDDVVRYSAAFNVNQATSDRCGGGWPDLGSQHFILSADHNQDSVTVKVTSTLDQPANDESFGVDNVILRVR